MSAIIVEHISKSYGDNSPALSDVSFDVARGEVFGLVGPDGGGKTTLFNIMTTLLFPDSGKITLLGLDVEKDYLKVRERVGYLPGTFSLYPDLTVEENLHFFAIMHKSSIKENQALILPIWEQLLPFKKRRAGKLSGGMKQKLSLCCALIHRPDILFLDEPTTGVDPVSRREFWDILTNIQTRGITVVVSTPYMDEATRCDRIALMQEGKIITIATPEQIIQNFKGALFRVKTDHIFSLLQVMDTIPSRCRYYPAGDYLHVSFYEEDTEKIPSLWQQFIQQNGLPAHSLNRISPTIEDCFIELIESNLLFK
ncbi:MAG: ABC transporter ATP-binding protein [Bacteroidales bacterium]|jgi:ABC-type multidrug transport system ATPase subunit|nr:ABC transporter ATP-binding protein [Bacteroidales bacterium]